MARKSKYTPERVEMIVSGIRDGLTDKDASLVAGISQDTLIIWKNRYSDFSDRLAQAHAERSRGWLAKIAEAAPKDWRAYAELLDRCAPEYRKSGNVNINIVLRDLAQKAAAAEGLDPDEVLAEAERWLSGAST